MFLFVFWVGLGCASPSEANTDVGLTFDLGKKSEADGGIDTRKEADMPTDSKTFDVPSDIPHDLQDRVGLKDPNLPGLGDYGMCFEEVVKIAEVDDTGLDEISGIAVSRSQDIIWVHNDSGDEDGQFYAIDLEGNLRGTFLLQGANSKDWEDMAIVSLDGKTYLYFGDTGDNDARAGNVGRANTRVYRIEEPVVDLSNNPNVAIKILKFETYIFEYPEKATDCESLFVDPNTGDLIFLEKKNSGIDYFFRAPKPANGSTTTLERLIGLDIPSSGFPGSAITAGSISGDGNWIAIRTYTSVLLFPWLQNKTFSEASSVAPIILPVPREIQGEAIDFADYKGESGVITISEGSNPAINFIKDSCK